MKGVLFILISSVFTIFCRASDEIKLMAYDIPAILQADKQGEYDLIIEQVNKLQQQKWRYAIAPPARVDSMFESNLIDCILPYDKAFYPGTKVINSAPLNIAKARIYSLSTESMSLNALKGKKVGARIGMLYGPEFDALKLDIKYVNSVEQNVEKLLSQRIDAFVAWSPDVEAVLLKKGLTLISSEPFVVHNEAFLCHDTPVSRAFIILFNEGIDKLTLKKQ